MLRSLWSSASESMVEREHTRFGRLATEWRQITRRPAKSHVHAAQRPCRPGRAASRLPVRGFEAQALGRRSGFSFSQSMWCRPSWSAVRSPARPRRSSPSQPHEHCAANVSGAPYRKRRSLMVISCRASTKETVRLKQRTNTRQAAKPAGFWRRVGGRPRGRDPASLIPPVRGVDPLSSSSRLETESSSERRQPNSRRRLLHKRPKATSRRQTGRAPGRCETRACLTYARCGTSGLTSLCA